MGTSAFSDTEILLALTMLYKVEHSYDQISMSVEDEAGFGGAAVLGRLGVLDH
jgi:hypothetical protein